MSPDNVVLVHADQHAADVVVVPLKSFDRAKSRLRPEYGPEGAADIARRLAAGVLAACTPRRTVVVCDDPDVASFATQHGAEVLMTRATSLNGAVADAYRRLTGMARIIVAHGDLREPAGLGGEPFSPGVTVVADHLGQGTNVLVVPSGLAFRFSYGPDSARRHLSQAQQLGVASRLVTDSAWRFDIDGPEDLAPRPDNVWGGPKAPPNPTP